MRSPHQACSVAVPLLRLALLHLLLVVAQAARATPALSTADAEGEVLRRLRQALRDAGAVHMDGGQPVNASTHPCTWGWVQCNPERRVTKLKVMSCAGERLDPRIHPKPAPPVPVPDPPPNVLLPELAGLEMLQALTISCLNITFPEPMPEEWWAPGAFPSLVSLSAPINGLPGTLPDIAPGALPRLELLKLSVRGPATLPPGWAAPGVLPALRTLWVETNFTGALPAAWARGFQRLKVLVVSGQPLDNLPVAIGGAYGERPCMDRQQPDEEAPRLPPEWAGSGAFPALEHLTLNHLGLGGPLPPGWVQGGFASLVLLSLVDNELTGKLPLQLFAGHTSLQQLWLECNLFTGTLPEQWADARALKELRLSRNAGLTGPAFPPAWLAPGAFPQLQGLDLASNSALGGTLPEILRWPSLATLGLEGTAVTGSVPPAWCEAPFAQHIKHLKVAQTTISTTLPTCAADAMPDFAVYNYQGITTVRPGYSQPPADRQSAAPTGGRHARWRLAAGAAAAAVLLAALATMVLRRKPQHSGSGTCSVPTRSGGTSSGKVAWRQLPSAAPGEQQAQPARLRALLSRQVAGANRALPLLPVSELRAAMAHQLGRTQAIGQAMVQAEEMRPLVASSTRPSARPDLLQRGSAVASLQWRLPTASLRIDAGQLEFAVDEEDTLVELGAGAFSVCYLAHLSDTLAAVKVIEVKAGMDSGAAWHEVSLMRSCLHPRVVPLLGVALRGNLLLLVLRFMEGGSLAAALQQREGLEAMRWEDRGWQVAADVAEALAFLHERNVLHGDIKPSNVLLSADGHACLADLGMAQVVGMVDRTPGFTRLYAAPEQLLGVACTLAADLYSFGLVLIVLASRQLLASRGEWSLPAAGRDCPQAVVSLIECCLSPDPARRPTAAQALSTLQLHGSAQLDRLSSLGTHGVQLARSRDRNQLEDGTADSGVGGSQSRRLPLEASSREQPP